MSTTATIAVLFCDVVGSTERQTRLGDPASDEWRQLLFSELRSCIAETRGVEVKSLGDGLMVVFERSTVDAIRCAQLMHRAAADVDPEDPLHLRIGISVGEVAQHEGDWFGIPVVEAARLCAVGDADQTLAPALIESLVGSRAAGHRFRPLGLMTLKGLARPIAVVRVDGTGDDDQADVQAEATESVGTQDWVVTNQRSGTPASGPTDESPRRRRARWLVPVAAVVVAVGLVGGVVFAVGSGGDDHSRVSSAAQGVTEASEFITEPVGYQPRFEATSCTPSASSAVPGAACGDLIVPETRFQPDGRTIRVPVVKAPAKGEPTADPVVLFDLSEPVGTTSLREDADVYLLWLRGFSASDGGLACDELPTAWGAVLGQRTDDPAAIASRVDAANRCGARLRDAGVQLEGYNMAEAANDIRDLVAVLGLGRVTVAASHSMTTAAMAFARADPGRVSALLLTDPTPPGSSLLEEPAATLQKSFRALAGLCADDRTCAHDFGDLEQRYQRRFEQLRSQPRQVVTKSLNGEGPFAVLLDGRRFANAVKSTIMDSTQVGLVPSALLNASDELVAAAAIGDDVANMISYTAHPAAYLSQSCSYDALPSRAAEVSDAALVQFAWADTSSFGRVCQAWAVPSVFEDLARPQGIDAPVLLVEGGLSEAGANRWAESMARSLPQAVVARFPTMNNSIVAVPPPCLADLRRAFVSEPTRPLDVEACTQQSTEVQFTATG